MARWRLGAPHYLRGLDMNGQKVEWEYQEVSRTTGKPIRLRFTVPMYLDPKDAADFNYPELGQIIVADKANPSFPRDIIIEGDPTPDMVPLDPDATKISAALAETKWKHPIESLPGDFSSSLLATFERQLGEAQAKQQNLSVKGVSPDVIVEMNKKIDALAAENARLSKLVSEKRV